MNNENFKRIFNENSKTFSLASKFFDERLFINISKLYYVCRCIDDIADNVKKTINPEKTISSMKIRKFVLSENRTIITHSSSFKYHHDFS